MEKERALTRTLPPGVMIGLKMLAAGNASENFDLHIDELNVLTLDNRSSSFHQLRLFGRTLIRDKSLFKSASLDVIHDFQQSRDS